jgi:hypothetical protein
VGLRWAGSERTTRAATELVVLFEPSGLVAKVRMRPGYQQVEKPDIESRLMTH